MPSATRARRSRKWKANDAAGSICIVMPFGPGDFADIAVRLLAQKLAERTQVVIENRPGVGGILAANAVSSAPDSYANDRCGKVCRLRLAAPQIELL